MIKGRYQLNTEQDAQEGFDHSQNEVEQFILHHRNVQLEPHSFNSLQPTALKKAKLKSTQKYSLSTTFGQLEYDSLNDAQVNLGTFSRHLKVNSLVRTRLDECELAKIEESQNKSLMIKKNKSINRQRSYQKPIEEVDVAIFKNKRQNKKQQRQIGQNLTIKYDSQLQEQQINEELKQSQNTTVIYRQKVVNSTHSYFKQLADNQESTFIYHKFNTTLRQKLDKFKHKPDQKELSKKDIQFKSAFESGNLQTSFKISQNQYNLYLRIDTHTTGHQSWFYFKVINHQNFEKRINLNICNLKKKFKMIEKGQSIFIKKNKTWVKFDEKIQMTALQKKTYKLSFGLTLLPHESVFISLIPPYTYSQLLKDIEQYEKSPNAKVISGLAIPVITITKNAKRELRRQIILKKKLFLVSGRIHPSQTCSSYIINGLIKELLSSDNSEVDAFLANTIIKIIPMLNPDGVVFGNFRTSYLGDDLNRSFHHTDESIYPEVIALKQIVKSCKNDFGDNFLAFIDMHGHSNRSNSFVYGPQFEQDSEEFTECRIFPKIFDKISKYFSYEMSTFKLEQYKYNTARGHFLRKYRIPSYTIETSYALFREKNSSSSFSSNYKAMSIEEWSQLGRQLALTLQIFIEYIFYAKKKNSTQVIFKKKLRQKQEAISKMIVGTQFSFYDVCNEINQQINSKKINKKGQNDENSSDSDGEPLFQDLPIKQKESLVKKVKDAIQTSYLFPRAMKPTMILPSIVPSIVLVSTKQKNDINLIIPKLSSKIRQKKFARPLNYNSQFNEYLLKNVNGIGSLKLDIINFSHLITKKLREDREKQQKHDKK